ncbi:MAG: SDR family oxidoreductase [Thermoanaerobaculum sp.]|nr:SDR family oxidoreductase [Thermoanaerobaculum sp.]MDW7968195.1 SDR family oxidoreductase [Thermoanaerobaculum sp.]
MGGKAAIVTGGGTGLGLAISRELGRRGYPVVLASRKREHLEAGASSLAGEGVAVHTVPCDVRDRGQVERVLAEAEQQFGGVAILVNNAAGNFVVKAEALSPRGWEAVRGIVLDGTWNFSQVVAQRWIAQGQGGSILNIIATYAWTGAAGVVHSVSAKAAVLAMTRSLAVEWGRFGIRVNALAPGIMVTEEAAKNLGYSDPQVQGWLAQQVPLGRLATPEEVARLAVDLVSDRHPYVTGDCWTVDGGLWLVGFPNLRRFLDGESWENDQPRRG